MNTAVLYSFRRCPYAMRARLALKYAGINVELREVGLNKLPAELMAISQEATVPVLQLPDEHVIEGSWEIAQWALKQNDPDLWRGDDGQYLVETEMLVEMNDYSFKMDLDHYKYADQYPRYPAEYYREQGEGFLRELEARLNSTRFLLADRLTIADIAIFPFIRQFAMVDLDWFDQASYPRLQQWLGGFINSDRSEARLFTLIMEKYEIWEPGNSAIYL